MSDMMYQDRPKLAHELHDDGANCAQAVACAFCDMTGLNFQTTMKVCGTLGGGFRCGDICGAVSGAGIVLGCLYPHDVPHNMKAKSFVSKKMMEFERRFLQRFPSLDCRDIRDLPLDLGTSPASRRLEANRPCAVYVISAVEILEEMIAEDTPQI